MTPSSLTRRRRRGSYSVLFAVSLIVPLGFGALAVDGTVIRLGRMQAQDIADAASQAALMTLRRTGDTAIAERAAQAVVARNQILGQAPALSRIRFGIWDDGVLHDDPVFPNGVEVEVSRTGDAAVTLGLARTLGFEQVEVTAGSTSATRSLQVIVVMDITGSWDWDDFQYARDAAVLLYDSLSSSHGPDDMLGLVTFHNVYGYAYTPLTRIDDDTSGSIRAQWTALGVSSKAGERDDGYLDPQWKHPCRYNERFDRDNKNDYTQPAEGGCFPNMPRWYSDENGTDHSVGVALADQMFAEQDEPGVYRAMLLLTDGEAADTRSYAGAIRGQQGYTETRYREYRGIRRSKSSVQNRTIELSRLMWDDLRVHTWMVSFVADRSWMRSVPQGDGYYIRTGNPAELVDIFEEISQSLPLAIVE